jgi:probable rRNA maturation factor
MKLIADIQIACDDDQPPPALIERWLSTALHHAPQQQGDETEITVRIVDEAEITSLNHNYRNNNKATNVLSFPADLPDHIELPLLGDLIICASVVAKEACEQGKPSQHHWAHMLVHGTLHLLGYDHIDDAEAEQMEALEVSILAALNIPDPYQTTVHQPVEPTKHTA